jgi:GT2 family glycosyltransferase
VGDVLLGYLHPNEVAASFHKSLLDLIGHDLSGARRLHSWAMIKCSAMNIAGGRNDLAKEFLAGPAEWLFMLDADMGFAPDTLEKLLHVADAEKRPIVGGLAFAQRESVPDGTNGFRCFPRPTLLDWIKNEDGVERFVGRAHYPVNALVRTGATGGACLLIHRSVIERVGVECFTQYDDATGATMGEDISFFDRCRLAEIPLHVHTGIRTTHYKYLWLGEEDFWTSFIAPPAEEGVDVIVPVLHRPQNIEPMMHSLLASTGLARAWFVCESGDNEEIAAAGRCGARVLTHPDAHTFAEKVNLAFRVIDDPAPWMLLVGDDVRFRPAWLDHAYDVHRRYGANVVGTNDLCNPRVIRGEHATHPMVRRSYVEEIGGGWDGPGVVCHEGYRHQFVDDEIVTAAKQRGTFQAALGSQVEHLHPLNGGAEMDDVYAAGEKHAKSDRGLFEARFRKHVGGR